MQPHGFESHDHSHCVSDAVAQVAEVCRKQGLKLTPVRRRTLEILLEEHRALGAYDVLERLNKDGFGSQPPVAYRALDFLTSNGFAHKIERLNAFVACTHPGNSHTPAFLICGACGTVAEADTDPQDSRLSRAAKDMGFTISRAVVEAEGTCPNCVEKDNT